MGDTTILKELLKKGEKIDLVNKNGNTLLEYACLQRDPNLILFLINHGANMKKHLFLGIKKFKLELNDIDTANILKICLLTEGNKNDINLDFLFTYIKPNQKIGLNGIVFKDFILFLKKVYVIYQKNLKILL